MEFRWNSVGIVKNPLKSQCFRAFGDPQTAGNPPKSMENVVQMHSEDQEYDGLCVPSSKNPAPQEPEKLYFPYVLSNSTISLALQSAKKL